MEIIIVSGSIILVIGFLYMSWDDMKNAKYFWSILYIILALGFLYFNIIDGNALLQKSF